MSDLEGPMHIKVELPLSLIGKMEAYKQVMRLTGDEWSTSEIITAALADFLEPPDSDG